MPVELLSELENKVETLLLSLEEVKDENIILRKTKEQSETRISELENENGDLKRRLDESEKQAHDFKGKFDSLKSDADGQAEKINAVEERIQGLLAKLEEAAR